MLTFSPKYDELPPRVILAGNPVTCDYTPLAGVTSLLVTYQSRKFCFSLCFYTVIYLEHCTGLYSREFSSSLALSSYFYSASGQVVDASNFIFTHIHLPYMSFRYMPHMCNSGGIFVSGTYLDRT